MTTTTNACSTPVVLEQLAQLEINVLSDFLAFLDFVNLSTWVLVVPQIPSVEGCIHSVLEEDVMLREFLEILVP
jgi:hypothetical protein